MTPHGLNQALKNQFTELHCRVTLTTAIVACFGLGDGESNEVEDALHDFLCWARVVRLCVA